jgi:hypothetical protein
MEIPQTLETLETLETLDTLETLESSGTLAILEALETLQQRPPSYATVPSADRRRCGPQWLGIYAIPAEGRIYSRLQQFLNISRGCRVWTGPTDQGRYCGGAATPD